MKKRFTKRIGIITLLLLGMINNVSAQFGGGDGSVNNPYVVTTAEQLFNIRTSPTSNYVIQNDIDLSSYQEGEGWLPIGGFSGHLDGKGNTIKNLKINRPSAMYQALFGQVLYPSRIENLHVVGDIVGGSSSVGGIAGICTGVISHCSFAGTVEGSNQFVGGIAGMISTGEGEASITKCYNTATVKGVVKVGGISGFSTMASSVTNCFNTGDVTATGNSIGGIVGFNDNSSVTNCYNTGKLSGNQEVGGIVGFSNPSTALISKCYNMGNVSSESVAGGIIGKNAETPVSDCIAFNAEVYGSSNLNRIAGQSVGSSSCYTNNYALDAMRVGSSTVTENDASSLNGANKSIREIKTKNLYENGLNWDFTDNWTFVIGYYPQLNGVSELPEPLFASGTGMEEDPYVILTAEQFSNIRKSADSYFILQNDIDLSAYQEGEGWMPIERFCGYLDGKGYAIKNLKINRPKSDYQGLIGNTYSNQLFDKVPEIKNLSLSGEIIGKKSVGGFIGTNNDVNIYKCSYSGSVRGTENVGAIVGYMATSFSASEADRLSIQECYSSANVISGGTAGGLLGLGSYAVVSDSYFAGSVTAEYGFIGGIIGGAYGWNQGQGPSAKFGKCLVDNCYNVGKINGGYKIGGIAGCANLTVITNSYNLGNIVNENEVGFTGSIVGSCINASVSGCVAINKELSGNTAFRIAGEKQDATNIENNYALSTMLVNGNAVTENGAQSMNGLNKTLAELGKQSTYEALGWDFNDTWILVNGYWPVLKNVSEIPVEMFGGGMGTFEDPYIITKPLHLDNVRNYLEQHFVLAEDIDLSGYQEDGGWKPIMSFKGTINGKGHKITNLKIDRPEANNQALFGYVNGAVIDSIMIVDGSVTGKEKSALLVAQSGPCLIKHIVVSGSVQAISYAAGVIAYNEGAVLDSCKNEADITGNAFVAGVSAYNNGNIVKCVNTGKIVSNAPDNSVYRYVGGIAALSFDVSIKKSHNEGDVSSNTEYVGGITGLIDNGTVDECYNTGNITGLKNVSGVVGLSDEAQVINSYNIGDVTADIDLGGVVGRSWKATTSNVYNKGNITGTIEQTSITGAVGGVIGVNDQSSTTLARNEGNVIGYDFVGGVAGVNTGYLGKSYNLGKVKGTDEYVGGVAGSNTGDTESVTLEQCYNKGEVESTHLYAGGIVGRNSTKIFDCYNMGTITGISGNGGIAGFNQTVGGGAVVISFCLNLGDVTGSGGYHGGIIGENGYSGQATFNVAANQRIDGTESYRIIGVENANMANYLDHNYALETMLINGVRVNSTNEMSYDGKGVSQQALWDEDTYLALGWDFDDNWFIADGISYPVLAWQPRLTANVTGKVSMGINGTDKVIVTLDKNGFEVDPMEDITWSYEKDKGITITSTDNKEYVIAGTKVGTTTLTIALNGGNTLYIPIEVTNGDNINNVEMGARAIIYPTVVEAGSSLMIDLSGMNETIKDVNLYDISSRLIQSLRVMGNDKAELRLDNVVNGTYILNVLTESGKRISRNIIVK